MVHCAYGSPFVSCFNRRGDSLGGAAYLVSIREVDIVVSIAGAILWGVLHGFSLRR